MHCDTIKIDLIQCFATQQDIFIYINPQGKKNPQNLNTPKSSQVRDHQTLLVLTGQPGKLHSFPHSLVNYLAPQLREEMTIIMKGLETSLPKPDSRRRQTNTK